VDRVRHLSSGSPGSQKGCASDGLENSYYTHTDENIAAIWHFLKISHQNGWIAKADRPMPWCPRCGTSLSEHEMSGSHRDITHTVVFVLAPVIDRDFDLLVWTTTPCTLFANTALRKPGTGLRAGGV
jgi:isoleucyl-tRNA synthetase